MLSHLMLNNAEKLVLYLSHLTDKEPEVWEDQLPGRQAREPWSWDLNPSRGTLPGPSLRWHLLLPSVLSTSEAPAWHRDAARGEAVYPLQIRSSPAQRRAGHCLTLHTDE